jgi:pyruvate,orthophosphate dikinase
VQRAYERFLVLNTEFLRLCHDWQVRPGDVPNDHADPRYDWGVLDRLRAFDERAAVVVRRIGRDVTRFEPYPRRLRVALERVDAGEHEWFTSPRIDSYHTVWMHVHEDLLLALGRDRADEPSA